MTKVKLWQIVGQTPNTIIFSDADGNLTTIPAGQANQVLVIGSDGTPSWVANNALATALDAKSDAAAAIATAQAYTQAQIAALVDNAPVALNTLNELAVKLNGEDSAINALLAQVEQKADKTSVDTQVAQGKQDAKADAKDYTDSTVSSAVSGIPAQIAGAKSEAIGTASADATFKASAARTDATRDAAAFTTQSIAQAVTTSSSDATKKSDAARTDAVGDAKMYTDSAVLAGLASSANDAQSKADTAKSDAITAAAIDAAAKVAALGESIPDDYVVEGTSTACYVASSKLMSEVLATTDGFVVTDVFSEVTGAGVSDTDTTLNAKLLFVNGLAMSNGWTASKSLAGALVVKFSADLAHQVFDGSDNAIMLLAEYKSHNAISLKVA